MVDIKNGIESLEFANISELAEAMVADDEGTYRTAVLPYYNAVWLVRELMLYKDVGVDYLDWHMPDYTNYEGCYYVTLDDEEYLSIEPCYRDDRFILCGGDVMFIDSEADSEIMRKNADEFDEMYEICFTDEYDDEPEDDADDEEESFACDCEHCTNPEITDVKVYIDGKEATLADVVTSVWRLFTDFGEF